MPSDKLAKKSTNKAVHEAVKKGDVKELSALFKDGASLNDPDDTKDRFTPIHWACYRGALECLHFLLWHGADTTVATPKGWTGAHVAAIRGQDACIQALITNGMNLNARDQRGSTALHMAAAHGSSFCLQSLLRAGVEVSGTDNNGWTPAHYAAFHGRLGCLQPLMRWGGSVDDTDSLGNTPAHLCAMEGQLACLKFLVGEAKSAVHVLGARNNNGDTLKTLAAQFYKQNVLDYIENIEWELKHPEENQNLAFPAHVAAYDGDLSHLRMLVENQIVDINEKDDRGSTPAHKAAGQGHLEIIQWIMEMGGDMTLTNQAGETPRDVARRFARLAIVRILGQGLSEDDDESGADKPKKKKKRSKDKKRRRKQVEVVVRSDGEEEEVEIDIDSSDGDSSSEEQVESRARAKKLVDKLEKQLEIATKNYLQFGGTLDERDERRIRDEREQRRLETIQYRKIVELEAQLDAERHRREKLEARIDQYKMEMTLLSEQLRSQHVQSDDENRGESRSNRKKKPIIKKRSTSTSKENGSFVHRKGNFKIV